MTTAICKLGRNAKLYYGPEDTALGSLSLCGNVRDLEINTTAKEADTTTRDSGGWTSSAVVSREITITFEMLCLDDDDGYDAMEDAWLNGTFLSLAALSGARDVSGSRGPYGNFSITDFTVKEPLEEASTVSVTAKVAAFDSWVKVT